MAILKLLIFFDRLVPSIKPIINAEGAKEIAELLGLMEHGKNENLIIFLSA